MPLKGKKPETIDKRLKLFMFGPAGIGKTTAAIQFPNAYIIDTERGSENYSDTIAKSGSVIFQSTNPDDIKAEIKTLLTEKHPYKTLIIDPITSLYNGIQDKWTRIFEKHANDDGKTKQAELQDFGMRYWGRVKSEYKTIQRTLMALDMNVIITSHQKDIYGANMQKIGVGPDSMKGDEYFFDFVFQLDRAAENRVARTIKERAEIGQNKFPAIFDWSYKNFLKYYGREIIEKEAIPVAMATPQQVAEINRLLGLVKIDDTEISRWFTKNDVDTWEEFKSDAIQKIIDHVNKKLEPAKAA